MRSVRRKCLVLLAVLACGLMARTAPGADYALLAGGLGGEERYSAEFVDSLTAVRRALTEKHGYAPERVRLLAERAEPERKVEALSTLENLTKELERLRGEMGTTDTLLLVLVGHGHSDFQQPKFNLPGPDLTAEALGRMLDALPARDQRLILAFPCSGHFSELLGRPLRTVLASTDGPRQIYHSVMPRFLAQAFQGDAADADLDGELTMYEVFDFLSQEVEGHFVAEGSLPTENPSLDDNGDGKVTTLAEGMDAGDGENARQARLTPAPSEQAPR